MSDPSNVPKLPGYYTEDPTMRKTTRNKTLVYKSGFSYVHPLEGGSESARNGAILPKFVDCVCVWCSSSHIS